MDTANKRLSAMNVGSPWRGTLPLPEGGDLDAADRQHLVGLYAGVLAAAFIFPVPLVYAQPQDLKVERVELWSDVEANGGIRYGPITNRMGLSEQVSQGEHTISLSLPLELGGIVRLQNTDPDLPNLRVDQVLRLILTGGTFENGGITEHRIARPTRKNQRGARTRTLVARSIRQDLGFRAMITRTTANGASTTDFEALSLPMETHIREFFLPALVEGGQPFWEIGTLQHATPIDMTYKDTTPLAGLLELAEKGGDLELDIRGFSTHYEINIVTRIGAGLEPLEVRARKNLRELGFEESDSDQATRVYAFGADTDGVRPSIGQAVWDVGGLILGQPHSIGLADPAGGPGPIQFDGQFLPLVPAEAGEEEEGPSERYYLQYLSADYTVPIVGSVESTQMVQVEGAQPPSGSHRARIVANADLRENLFVDHPQLVKPAIEGGYGVRVAKVNRPDIPATDNLVPNPLGRIWPDSSPLPTHWARTLDSNNTCVRETSPRYWEHGGVAQRHKWFGAPGSGSIVVYPLVAPVARIPLHATGYLSFFVRITPLVNRVQVNLYLDRPETAESFPYPAGEEGWRYVVTADSGRFGEGDIKLPDITTSELNTSQDIGVVAVWDLGRYPLYGGTATIQIQPARGEPAGTECIVHAVQITNSHQQLPLLEGNGGVRLHQAANEKLARCANPAPLVSVGMVDLSVLGGSDPRLAIGRPIRIYDKESDVTPVETRIVGWSRDWDEGRAEPQLELSNERRDITNLFTARKPSARHRTVLVPPGTRGLTYED